MTDTEDYKTTAINSFRLAVELFNRPTERGRIVGVLKFLNHSFEMLLKASILKNGGDIRGEEGEGTQSRLKSASTTVGMVIGEIIT